MGPLLFTIYASSLFDIMKSHLPSVHTYADDTQLYISFNPVDNTSAADAVIAIENCIHDVRAWMRDDKLMLKDDKTEFLIIGTERQLSRVSVDKIKISQAEVSPVSSVCNLGTWFNSHLDMLTHVTIRLALARFIICTISGTLGSICLVSPPRGLFTRSSQAGLITVMVYCTVLLSIKLRNFKES